MKYWTCKEELNKTKWTTSPQEWWMVMVWCLHQNKTLFKIKFKMNKISNKTSRHNASILIICRLWMVTHFCSKLTTMADKWWMASSSSSRINYKISRFPMMPQVPNQRSNFQEWTLCLSQINGNDQNECISFIDLHCWWFLLKISIRIRGLLYTSL